MQKRIIIETTCLLNKHNGIYNTVNEVISSLTNLGFSVSLVRLGNVNGNLIYQLYYSLKAFVYCHRCLNKDDVLLIPNNMSFFWFLPHKRTWIIIHDIIPLSEEFGYKGIRRILYRFKMKNLKKAEKIITISQYVKKLLIQSFSLPADKIDVLYWFSSLTKRNSNSEALINYDFHKYFVSIGTGEPRKDAKNLILEWKQSGLYKDYNLVLFGKPFSEKAIHALLSLVYDCGLKDCVHVIGAVSNRTLISLLSHSCGFIFNSKEEGFGLPPLEALSLGVNVILRDTEINRELYSGIGFFYDIENSSLSKAIINASKQTKPDMNILFTEKYSHFNFKKSLLEIFNVV